MKFQITNIECYISPNGLDVDRILEGYGMSLSALRKTLLGQVFTHTDITKGFQVDLAPQLMEVLSRAFCANGAHEWGMGYSPTMREKPDVAVGRKGHPKKIFVEIEFRPNEHKDIVKFLIGHKKQTLELGILLVATNRKSINKDYYTMPEYKKCMQTIEELQSDCPILVMGIDGRWIPEEV